MTSLVRGNGDGGLTTFHFLEEGFEGHGEHFSRTSALKKQDFLCSQDGK